MVCAKVANRQEASGLICVNREEVLGLDDKLLSSAEFL